MDLLLCFFFSSRRRHTRWPRDWSSDVCSSDLEPQGELLSALGTEVHLAAPGQRLAAVGALAWRLALLRELERRPGKRRLFCLSFFSLVIGAFGRFGRRGERWKRRWRERPLAPENALGGEAIEAQDRIGELAEERGVGIRLRRFALQRVPHLGGLERREPA